VKKKTLAAFTMAFMSVLLFTNNVFADYQTEGAMLKYGMRNGYVKQMQEDLKDLGYFHYNSTGYFGNLTYQSVVNYQTDNHLAVDGIVGPKTSREIKVDSVIKDARRYLGVPYVWGGVSPSGFDCSGFTHYVMLKNNIIIQRTASAQYTEGNWVSKANLKRGDLVFFSTYKAGASHVGIYLGNDQFIHASSGAAKVTISNLSKSYYQQRYIGAKRFIR
jgi:cell wall-associated NlpC family hydrolase